MVDEIGSFAVTVNPFDVDAIADSIYQALTMPRDERLARADAIRGVVLDGRRRIG